MYVKRGTTIAIKKYKTKKSKQKKNSNIQMEEWIFKLLRTQRQKIEMFSVKTENIFQASATELSLTTVLPVTRKKRRIYQPIFKPEDVFKGLDTQNVVCRKEQRYVFMPNMYTEWSRV